MGLEGISIWQLLIVLLIVVLLFGTTKLKNVGSDLGSALKSFRSAMRDDEPTSGDSGKERTRGSLDADEEKSGDAEFSRSEQETSDKTGDRRG